MIMKALAVSTTSVLFTMLSLAQHWALAQGTQQLLEGKTYMVAFPQVIAAPTEKPMPQPMQLIISSRTDASVRVSTPAVINDAARIDKTYKVLANKTLRIPVPIGYMNVDSEKRNGYGILVSSDVPISVSTYQAWMGNGEMARHLPTEGWGKSYYSMNMYQDRYGTPGAGYKYRPSQIVVVANYDNTVVTYTPTFDTEGGADVASVRKGTSQSVTLNRGETFLIKSKIDTTKLLGWETDLSGTFIRSNKPIGVLSGHVKCSVLRYPDVLPPTGMFASEAHFVRSNVHDVMLPLELAGKEFVTIPCMYTPLRNQGAGVSGAEIGIENDRGDLIRLVALEDGTVVKSMNPQGSGIVTEWTLNKGETRTTTREYPVYWESSKPILVGQYGKSYAKVLPPRRNRETEDPNIQGHPSIEAGMPMLQTVPSADRWINYGAFHAPEGMDNFFSIVYVANQIDKIVIDKRPLKAAFGGAAKLIPGTMYGYIRTPIGTGDHYVESTDSSARWMAWNHGSLDGLQQGRAYGSPVGIDLAIPCNDSVSITDQTSCGDVNSTGSVSSKVGDCGSIFALNTGSIDNYNLKVDENFVPGDQQIPYSLTVVDKTKDASAKVRVVSRSGKYVERTYTYRAPKLSGIQNTVDFGFVRRSDTVTPSRTLSLRNEINDQILSINSLRFASGSQVFSLDTAGPIDLGPLKSKDVSIRLNIVNVNDGVYSDTLLVDVGCHVYKCEVRLTCDPVRPIMTINDLDWDNAAEVPYRKRKSIIIRNGGDGMLIIRDYERTKLDQSELTNHFYTPDRIDSLFPLYIAPKDSFEIAVEYNPRGEVDVLHKQSVTFFSNAVVDDSVCRLTGVAWSSADVSDETRTQTLPSIHIQPNPAVNHLDVSVTGAAIVDVQLLDPIGRCVLHCAQQPDGSSATQQIIDIGGLPCGSYIVVVVTPSVRLFKKLQILR